MHGVMFTLLAKINSGKIVQEKLPPSLR